MTIAVILQLFMLTILTLYVVVMIYSIVLQAPPIPSPKHVHKRMAKMITQHSSGQKHIAELGAGTGQMAKNLSKFLPTAHITAFEYSPIPRWLFKQTLKLFPKANITLTGQSIYDADFTKFNILVAYLSKAHMPKIARHIKETKFKGLVILLNESLPNHTPIISEPISGFFFRSKLNIYQI